MLRAILELAQVAAISGGNWPQIDTQLLANLPHDEKIRKLSLLPTCGTKYYQYRSEWTPGLLGRYNDIVAEYAIRTHKGLHGKLTVWVVGERVNERMSDAGITPKGDYPVPISVQGISPLIRELQNDMFGSGDENARFYVFHNHPRAGALFEPVSQRLLPLDAQWQHSLINQPWPTKPLPQVLCVASVTLRALVREYLFISLF